MMTRRGGEEDEDRPTKNKHNPDKEEEPEVKPKGKRVKLPEETKSIPWTETRSK